MNGKVCMVTGATSGMGVVTAQALAQHGAKVIVIGRSREKGITTVSQIRRQTGNPAVELLLADLSSQSEVRHLAQTFTSQHDRLDVLINNAGAIFTRRQETIDGIEVTLALNHLAGFLLTNLLLDALKASAPARIINVSSFAHKLAKIRFADLQGKRRYVGWQVYAQSKLANLLFTYELAQRLEGTGVTVNALDPGLVATNFGLSEGGVVNLFKRLLNPLALSPEEGARTSIYLATSPHVEGITGQYFVNCRPVKSSQASHDRAAANRLWRVSAELTGLYATM